MMNAEWRIVEYSFIEQVLTWPREATLKCVLQTVPSPFEERVRVRSYTCSRADT
jgi:hypothetical protein